MVTKHCYHFQKILTDSNTCWGAFPCYFPLASHKSCCNFERPYLIGEASQFQENNEHVQDQPITTGRAKIPRQVFPIQHFTTLHLSLKQNLEEVLSKADHMVEVLVQSSPCALHNFAGEQ